jgi:hypothetical protein
VISVFERLVASGAAMGLNVGFDCGFTPCMFSQEFVEAHADMFRASVPVPNAKTTVGQSANRCAGTSKAGCNEKGIQTAHSDGSIDQTQKASTTRLQAVGVRCSPVVDILPEGDCIACYALSRFRRIPLPSKGHRDDLVSFFDDELLPVLPAGVHRECIQCDYRLMGRCNGGCRARRSLRLRPNALIHLDPDPMGRRIHT